MLGCAGIAWRRSIPALLSCPQTSLIAVASRDPAKARTFADRFDCAASSYEDLLRRDDIDAIYLPLPPSLHLPWGLAALRAGKHLLLEKPASTTAENARELVRAANEHGLVLRENFTFAHHSQHRAVQALLAAGRLGELRSFSAAFCFPPLPDSDIRYRGQLGGGALLDAGVYPVRAAQLLLGEQLRVIGATLRVDPVRAVDVGGQALLLTASGVQVSVQFGFEHAYGSWYSVWGSTGRLHLDRAFAPQASWAPVLRIEEQAHTEELTLAPDHQFERCVDSFATAVLTGRTAGHPDEARQCAQTVQTMQLLDEIRRQAVLVEVSGPRPADVEGSPKEHCEPGKAAPAATYSGAKAPESLVRSSAASHRA